MSSTEPRIGIVTWDYVPPIGGMGRHVTMLADQLGAEVFSRRDLPLPFGRNILFSLVLGPFLRHWIRAKKIGLVHVHTGPGGVLLLRKPAGIRLVVTVNHTYAQQSRLPGEGWKKLLMPWERRTIRFADTIICISDGTADEIHTTYGIDPQRIMIIPGAVDVPRFAAADRNLAYRSRSCVFVGRADTRKGFDLLRAAWVFVGKAVPGAALDVVGWKEPSSGSVTFHGKLSDDALPALVGSSRVVVCPSRFEGFGLVAAEAISGGTPVVATDTAGLRSVVAEGDTGLLSALSPADIAAKLILLLTEDSLWERLHEGCRRKRDAFTVPRSVALHREIYRALY